MKPDILHGDCRDTLKTLPENSVHCCVTSPPYWGLRSYLPKGHADKHLEIGSEPTPEAFVETMVQVFREVRRVLHPSGTVWLNLGDSFYGAGWSNHENTGGALKSEGGKQRHLYADCNLKPKDLCMIPWRVALALQADGWWVRSAICWHKKSCMPESVTDRPTNSWEPIFLLAKSARYFYDAEAVKETAEGATGGAPRKINDESSQGRHGANSAFNGAWDVASTTRNQRNVWSLGPEPYSEAHFATFPTEIPRRAILAGTSARGCCPKCLAPWERVVEKERVRANGERIDGCWHNPEKPSAVRGGEGGFSESRTVGWQPTCKCDAGEPIPCTVLDPFGGSGTTGQVAIELGRKSILCELNPEYLPLIEKRTNITPGLALA